MVDLLRNCGCFTLEEAAEFIENGALNGLFVLGRTMGFIGMWSIISKIYFQWISPLYFQVIFLIKNVFDKGSIVIHGMTFLTFYLNPCKRFTSLIFFPVRYLVVLCAILSPVSLILVISFLQHNSRFSLLLLSAISETIECLSISTV